MSFFSPRSVWAAISGCTVSVDPTSVEASTISEFTFTLTNNDTSNNGLWFKITKPHTDVSMVGYAVSPTWIRTSTADSFIFKYDTTPLVPGATINPHIMLSIGDVPGISGNWIVQMADNIDGSNPTTCTGSLPFAVTEVADHTSPSILTMEITNITFNEATVNWTTDEASTSLVKYDVSAGQYLYPLSKSESELVTSHSITLVNLGASTPYYFSACSTDASGNEGCSDEYSFTTGVYTAGVGTTLVVTVNTTTTTTTTTTIIQTPTPTPTPLPDRVKPKISLTSNFEKVYEEAPILVGTATDNKEITDKVEYSLDGGKNWLPVEDVELKTVKQVNFEFEPEFLDDGNYQVKVRVTDKEGNIGISQAYVLIIDRLPPQIGSCLFSIGPQVMWPNNNGEVEIVAGMKAKINLSSVGGANTIDVWYEGNKFGLSKIFGTNLWTGEFEAIGEGLHDLTVVAVDGANNKTDFKINTLKVVSLGRIEDSVGKPIKGAKISAFVFDSISNEYNLWEEKPYDQINPLKSDDNGGYALMLPPGKYYLDIEAPGRRKVRSSIFTLTKSTLINADFRMGDLLKWVWWPETRLIEFEDNISRQKNPMETKLLPDFELETKEGIFNNLSTMGANSIISVVSLWNPSTADQLKILDEFKQENKEIKIFSVLTHQSIASVKTLKKMGQYSFEMVADPDGKLNKILGVVNSPTHIMIDNKGVVKKYIVGLLTKEELFEELFF